VVNINNNKEGVSNLVKSIRVLDWLFVCILILLVVGIAIGGGFLDSAAHPQEDAAMLMRYSQNLAQGYGIVWNVGEAPIDGATDFLYMALIAGLDKIGIPLETAARGVLLASHILTALIIYIAVRKLHGASPWVALISAAFLAVGNGLVYTHAFFGTPFFTLFVCVTWVFAYQMVKNGSSHLNSLLFAVSALVMGLIRPEGVLIAIFMLLAILYMLGLKESKKAILYFIGIFAIFGGLYFFWRWHYFGYPLPNPFYIKGGGLLSLSGLYDSITNVVIISLPFSLAMLLGFWSSKTTRYTIFTLIPIVGFTLIWVLLSDPLEYYRRFQYPILPIILISWPPLLYGIREKWNLPKLSGLNRRSRVVLILLTVIISLGVLYYSVRDNTLAISNHHRDGRYDVAIMLDEYSHKNYSIATTEAGLLPYYSNWRAIDTYGLNDQWIAHNGGITKDYLELNNPEIIMLHGLFSPITPIEQEERKWFSMVMTLKEYAEENGYILAASYGDSPYDTHYYYVWPDFPDSQEIVQRIQSMDYYWYVTGEKSINYALLSPKYPQ